MTDVVDIIYGTIDGFELFSEVQTSEVCFNEITTFVEYWYDLVISW